MPTPNDEQFENYLKRFRPLESEPLPIPYARPVMGLLVFASWAAVTAGILIAAALIRQSRYVPPINHADALVDERLTTQLPLTIGAANGLLAQSSSFNETLDRMALQPRSSQVSKGKHSAIALLSKEKIKL